MRRRNAEIIEAWWQQDPEFNIGVACGAVSGIFVVDVDGLDAEAELRKLEREHGDLAEHLSKSLRRALADTFTFKMPQTCLCAIRPARSRLASMCAATMVT